MPKVADIINIIDMMAPRRLAEEWDNVGLHYGDPDWSVSKVLVSLDPTLKAMEFAAEIGADMLVTHHPLIFKPVKTIQVNSPVGAVIDFAAQKRIAVFCAHTNLDAAVGGINDVLAEKIGMKVSGPLSSVLEPQRFNVVVFTPPGDVDRLFHALSETSAGQIGDYSQCCFRSLGTGRFIPGDSSKPHIGKPGVLTETEEARIEITVGLEDLNDVISRIKASHRYETPAYDIYPLHRKKSDIGMGRIGQFESERNLGELAHEIKQALALKVVKIAGSPDLMVKKGAVCSGGGAGMIKDFFSSDAQVYISGDLNHHVALDIAASNRGLIDIGHFNSEQIIVPMLCNHIEKEMDKLSMPISVLPWAGEIDPFTYL